MIVKDPKGGFMVVSEKSHKNLGGGLSKAGAMKRLQQVEYFKHKKEGGGKSAKGYKARKAKRIRGKRR